MNVISSFDYDSLIDDLLFNEEHLAENCYNEGTEKSSKNSYQQGFQLGFKKGHDIGLEIGFYKGILTAIKKLQISKIIQLTDKQLDDLQKLSFLIEIFPQINDINVNIIEQFNKIKGLYKKFCYNLKTKDLDKNVFIYLKWTN